MQIIALFGDCLHLFSMTELHPSLVFVNNARTSGMNGDYDDCLTNYANAKKEAEKEIDLCRNILEKGKWNSLVKDIVQEEAAIRRLKSTISEITSLMNVDDQHRLFNQQMEQIPAVQTPSRSEFVNTPIRRRPKAGEKRPSFLPREKRASVSPKRESSPTRTEQRQAIHIEGYKQINLPMKSSSRDNLKDKERQQKAAPPKKEIPPAENPLVQQIIDMGILVREPNVQWESIAGLTQVKRLLRQNLVILPMRPDIAKGLLSPWRSVLFYGPPGTGKTFLAKAVATECKRTFFNVTSATITSRFLGESEKLVTYLFNLAEEMQPSTIFFDEIDSIASQRGSQGEHEASRRMKAQLLTRLEGIDGTDASSVFVMAATNFPWDLDEALLRRFQKRVYIPLPDEAGREAILTMHIGENMSSDFDTAGFVKKLEGYSCADIANLCRDVAQAALDKQTDNLDTQQWLSMPAEDARVVVTNADFEAAMKRRKSSVDPATIKKYEQWRQLKGAE